MRTQPLLVAMLFPLTMLLTPPAASAQWRYPPGYPGYPGYPSYRYAQPESHLRIDVTPKEASVYVDGYFAGRVEEFDGRFQRLHVPPGEHEIVIWLEGYHPLRRQLYLSTNATRTIEGSLERLAPGEAQEPQPVPSERDRIEPRDDEAPPPPIDRRPMTRRPGREQPPPERPRGAQEEPSRFATLSIQVRPGGGIVRIDGERWDAPGGDERLIVQVAEGRHLIEVERDGYERFSTEIDARRGETTPVNISLRRR